MRVTDVQELLPQQGRGRRVGSMACVTYPGLKSSSIGPEAQEIETEILLDNKEGGIEIGTLPKVNGDDRAALVDDVKRRRAHPRRRPHEEELAGLRAEEEERGGARLLDPAAARRADLGGNRELDENALAEADIRALVRAPENDAVGAG
jgi:hypothetical protein